MVNTQGSQSLLPDVSSQKPNLIVTDSYLSQLFTQKRAALTRFHKCWPEAVSKSSHN